MLKVPHKVCLNAMLDFTVLFLGGWAARGRGGLSKEHRKAAGRGALTGTLRRTLTLRGVLRDLLNVRPRGNRSRFARFEGHFGFLAQSLMGSQTGTLQTGRPANPLKFVHVSCTLKLKVPFTKYPFASLPVGRR